MNYPFIFHQLSVVCVLLGAFMFLSLPWALSILGGQWQDEASGVLGLILSIVACFLSAGIFRYFGSKTLKNVPPDLFSKREAIAVVGLAWILATLLGALPYLIAGVHRAENTPMTVCDALFESQSGFSTTGATVFGEVERPDLLPRCILFWRFSTHFLGGLGIMLLFVVLLGYGTGSGFGMGMKSILRSEMTGPTKAHSQNHIQELGRIVFWIYVGMNVVQTTILVFLGVDLFDAICHSFTTVSTGGFSTFNASAGHFAAHGFSAASAIEWTLIIFMFLGGMNFMLLYLGLTGKMMAILKDAEWRAYVSVLLVAIVVLFAVGMVGKDFDNYGTADVPYYVSNEVSKVPIGKKTPQHSPTEKEEFYDENVFPEEDRPNPEGDEPGNLVAIPNETLIEAPRVLVPVLIALRVVVFQVVSIMTTTGLCTDEYEKWSGLSCCVIILLMFLGGCAGSTAGGFKMIRVVCVLRSLPQEIERAFRPNVVRPLLVNGVPIDREIVRNIMVHFTLMTCVFVTATFIILCFEPASTWGGVTVAGDRKLMDTASAVACSLNNVGPGLGLIGARQNFGVFSDMSKFLFTWVMMLGRLEFFVILALFHRGFWRK